MILKKDTLTEEQATSLAVYRQELEEKIYGPKITVEKNTPKDHDYIKYTLFDSGKPTVEKIILYTKEELDIWVKRLHESVIPASLIKRTRSVYVNILYTYGSIQNAFKENGRENPISKNWKKYGLEYLGILPDPWIAEIVGVPEEDITKYRILLKINTVENNLFNPKYKKYTLERLILEQKGFNACMHTNHINPSRKN